MMPAIATYLFVFGLAAPPPTPRAAPAPAPTAPDAPSGVPSTEGDAPSPSTGAEGPNASETAPTADKVTRYSFTGLDIDGELRTPALLQFLARIAGEFETLGIPHRSFMPELRATVGEDAL